MDIGTSFAYQGSNDARLPNSEPQESVVQTRFTPEELRCLRECNKESFYYRCLPLALMGMALTHLGVKRGLLVAHPKWGSSLKMTGAAFVGWIFGKFSYRTKCEDKFLHLENSALGEAIRKKRGISIETFKDEFPSATADDEFALKDDKFSYFSNEDYHSSSGSLNLDVDKNIQFSGFDDRDRPSTDRDIQNFSEDNESNKKFTTYDELRRKNRGEFERLQRQVPKSESTYSSGAPKQWSSFDNRPPKRFNLDSNEGTSKNIYGDSWESPKLN